MCNKQNCGHAKPEDQVDENAVAEMAEAVETEFDMDRPRIFLLYHFNSQSEIGTFLMPTRLISPENIEESLVDAVNGSVQLNPKYLPPHIANNFTLVPLNFSPAGRVLRKIYDSYQRLLKPSPYLHTHINGYNDFVDNVRELFSRAEYYEVNTAADFFKHARYICRVEQLPGDEDFKPELTKKLIFGNEIDFPIDEASLKE